MAWCQTHQKISGLNPGSPLTLEALFFCSLSHKLLSNQQNDTASLVSDIAGHRGISVSFCFGASLFCRPLPLLLSNSFPLFLRQGEGSLKRCTTAPLLAHAATMRCFPLPQHYASIIQRHWNKAVCLFYLLKRKENCKWKGTEVVTISMLVQLKTSLLKDSEEIEKSQPQ